MHPLQSTPGTEGVRTAIDRAFYLLGSNLSPFYGDSLKRTAASIRDVAKRARLGQLPLYVPPILLDEEPDPAGSDPLMVLTAIGWVHELYVAWRNECGLPADVADESFFDVAEKVIEAAETDPLKAFCFAEPEDFDPVDRWETEAAAAQ